MGRLSIITIAGLLSVLAVASGSRAQSRPAAAPPVSLAPEGKYGVTITDPVKLHDTKRNRDLSVKVYSPDAPGRLPVIVFSHAGGASRESFGPLARYWTSHGFVSIHPSHADAAMGGAAPSGEPPPASGALRGLLTRTMNSPAAGANRARDLSAVIDGLDDLEKSVPALKGKLDRKRIGVGGLEFGAFTAMLLGGTTVDLSESQKDRAYLDPRVRAVLAVSGPGAGQQGLTERSWRKVYVPMLTVTGSRDTGAGGKGPEWKRQSFDLSRPGDKYLLFLEGASQYSFGGELAGGGLAAGGLGPGMRARLAGGRRVGFGGGMLAGQDRLFEAMKRTTLDFWNAYLKDDPKAKVELTTTRLSRLTDGTATLTHR